jgi:hypothetical protein
MKRSASTSTVRRAWSNRTIDLQLAWLDAADDASEAYIAWRGTDGRREPEAYAVYLAALDREEAAARALQSELSAAA